MILLFLIHFSFSFCQYFIFTKVFIIRINGQDLYILKTKPSHIMNNCIKNERTDASLKKTVCFLKAMQTQLSWDTSSNCLRCQVTMERESNQLLHCSGFAIETTIACRSEVHSFFCRCQQLTGFVFLNLQQ